MSALWTAWEGAAFIPWEFIKKKVWNTAKCFQRKKPHKFWWRLGIMKTWNYSWFLCEKDVYPVSNIAGAFKASVRMALSNLAVFKEVCTKLKNHLGFTMSQASHFYFHFISICARNRASCNKSLLRAISKSP